MLRQQLDRVRERIQQACQRCGRPASSVTLVSVTKGVAVDGIREAVALGLTDLGENRVQEARAKQAILGSRTPPVRWHLIGHLQRNKARHAVELFDVVHSVDSLDLIEKLEKATSRKLLAVSQGAAPETTQWLDVFVQVNISGEMTKHGCRPENVQALARRILCSQHLKLRGLMTIAPFVEDQEEARPHFRNMRMLRDDLVRACSLQPAACSLSMGMSQDFEVAIEEGADFVRIGTAIFG